MCRHSFAKSSYKLEEWWHGAKHREAEDHFMNLEFKQAYEDFEQSALETDLLVSRAAVAYMQFYGIGTGRDRSIARSTAAEISSELSVLEQSHHYRPVLYSALLTMSGLARNEDDRLAEKLLREIDDKPLANYFLATLYSDPTSTLYDRDNGIRLFEISSELPISRFRLATLQLSDPSDGSKYQKAINELVELSNVSPAAMEALGLAKAYGFETNSDPVEGLSLLAQAHRLGHTSAPRNVGNVLDNKFDLRFTTNAANVWNDRAAKLGDNIAVADKVFSELTEGSSNALKDAAIDTLKSLVENEHTYAINLLGIAHRDGFAGEQDQTEANKLFETGASLGSSMSMRLLSVALYNPSAPGSYSHQRSLKLLEDARQTGDINAVCDLASIAIHGKTEDVDLDRAEMLLNSIRLTPFACESEVRARLLEKTGEISDHAKIIELYEKAAKRGSASAQIRLAYIYYHGQLSRSFDRSKVEERLKNLPLSA